MRDTVRANTEAVPERRGVLNACIVAHSTARSCTSSLDSITSRCETGEGRVHIVLAPISEFSVPGATMEAGVGSPDARGFYRRDVQDVLSKTAGDACAQMLHCRTTELTMPASPLPDHRVVGDSGQPCIKEARIP